MPRARSCPPPACCRQGRQAQDEQLRRQEGKTPQLAPADPLLRAGRGHPAPEGGGALMGTIVPLRPQAWAVLEQALTEKRPVALRYHGPDRILCPHAIGWKNGRLP